MKLFALLLFLTTVTSAQWIKQNVNTTASFRGLSVVNEKVVWASGTDGTVIKTTDGGKSWNVMTVPGAEKLDFRDIEAFDANTAYILSIGNGESSRIYKTTDGGATWKLQYTNTNEKAFFDAIACWDVNNCLAMSDPVDGHYILLSTDDGGATGMMIDTTKMPAAKDGEAAFAASGTCLITHGTNTAFLVSGGNDARVFRSQDRGRTWAVADTPIMKGTPGSGIFSVAMSDANNGVIVGGNYEKPAETKDTLALTADGGKTWRPGTGLTGFRSGVAYIDKKTIIAVGTNGTDLSRNGGKTWTKIGNENLNAVAVKGKKAVWAVGPKGMVVTYESSRPMKSSRARDVIVEPVDVVDVILSRDRVSLTCTATPCDQLVDVAIVAPDVPNIGYLYKVSGGRIVGVGANVRWDLSGVRPGQYTVTAAVDDGGPWGPIGKTRTKAVTVIE